MTIGLILGRFAFLSFSTDSFKYFDLKYILKIGVVIRVEIVSLFSSKNLEALGMFSLRRKILAMSFLSLIFLDKLNLSIRRSTTFSLILTLFLMITSILLFNESSDLLFNKYSKMELLSPVLYKILMHAEAVSKSLACWSLLLIYYDPCFAKKSGEISETVSSKFTLSNDLSLVSFKKLETMLLVINL